MRNFTITFIIIAIKASCGLVSKYPNGQHSIYAKMLTQSDKAEINQKGEITKDIELGNPGDDSLLKGTLRIMKTNDPDLFNFIQIGQWIDHGRLGNSGKVHNLEFRDTIVYDNSGNILSRVVYYKNKPTEYSLGERWTIEEVDSYFVRHIKQYKDNILISEYDRKLLEFNIPKSDFQKKTILIGTRNDYSSKGQLISRKIYNNNGELLKEEKYGR